MNPIEILMRAKWDSNYRKLSELNVVVRHRGAPNDEKIIPGDKIKKIQKDGFWYLNNLSEEIFIPAHRIIKIEFLNL